MFFITGARASRGDGEEEAEEDGEVWRRRSMQASGGAEQNQAVCGAQDAQAGMAAEGEMGEM